MKTGLVWFTQDLRTTDNPMLQNTSSMEGVVCVYCIDPRWFKPGPLQAKPMGATRWRFIWQAIEELSQSLALLGHKLHVLYGHPERVIVDLLQDISATDLFVSRRFATYEKDQLEKISAKKPLVNIHQADSYTLFDLSQVSTLLEHLPSSFSAFRRRAEKLRVPEPCKISRLPTPINFQPQHLYNHEHPIAVFRNRFTGGETTAAWHLGHYFASQLPIEYKKTRNYIDDWDSSTKFSPWLNQGCMSSRQIVQQLWQYEARHGKNSGTEWIFFELLWREFFQWLSHKIGCELFTFKGLSHEKPLTSFYPDRFKRWSKGETPWPIVNACMRQMNETGYLSNRGRQIAASALINELAVDWRYGAAWFEQQLIDYDAASNWGNWQYIAGVGVDSRGGRHFDIDKQTSLYDPEGSFCKQWAGTQSFHQIDHLDPTGWPITRKVSVEIHHLIRLRSILQR